MVRGAALVITLALAWVCVARASVLVPTYVLPPDSFVRDQRSLGTHDSVNAESHRTIKRLIGGHMKIKSDRDYGKSKNSILTDAKSESGKFVGMIAPDQSGGTVGWNQGIWDDGMLMSSAGEGKETGKLKEDEEDKKTLSDQVAEGKYGLIQNEIFSKTPKRPGIVSYKPNSETRSKDNIESLGGLKKEEIWLAEDHLLVLKGGSFPEKPTESDQKSWPPIDNYEAPKRQVKLPQKPKIPPPFPVQLTDDGPLVFLTPNGSVPASIFPPFPTGEGQGSLYPPPFIFPTGTTDPQSFNQGNFTAGETPLPIPPFPFLPGNASEGAFPFLSSMNGSFPEGFPPGAAFLPPPSNQTDLYDEDDPSIYYPPPYSFSFHADYNNSVPAGPLVPGIILPPPPDFFAPLEERTTTTEVIKTRPTYTKTYSRAKIETKPPSTTPIVHRGKYKTRPTTTTPTTTTTTESTESTELPTTVPEAIEIETTPKYRKPQRIVTALPRKPVKNHNLPEEITSRPKTQKPVYKSRTKLTSKPLSVSVFYDYSEPVYDTKTTTTEKPYIVYKLPENEVNDVVKDITSTSVPLRTYYNTQNDEIPTTKLQPVYKRPNDNGLASFYFFDEQPKTNAPETFYEGRNYYNTNQGYVPKPNVSPQNGFTPAVTLGSINQGSDALFLWPQKQGTRTLTQEYFSIQNPKHPDPFYQQIADIQQTIDFFTTKRPKLHGHRHTNKPKPLSSRPVYQFSYETKARPDKLTFRAPKLDPEPFRPMVSYSKPFNTENGFNAISPSVPSGYQQYFVENVQITTENPTSSRYYPKTKIRDEDYEDATINKVNQQQSNQNHIPIQTGKPVHRVNIHSGTTPNPISHGYYTKQDERYLDDNTKNSFDIFGQKLEDNSRDVNGLAVTPPIGTVKTPIDNNIDFKYVYENVDSKTPKPLSLERDTLVNNRFPRPQINPLSESIHHVSGQLVQRPRPPSLLTDTLVNDRLPRPSVNPDSEFIPIPKPNYTPAQYRAPTQVQRPQYTGEQFDLNQPSLVDDININYKRPLPPINPDAEWISPANAAGEGRPGSFVSYRLPGEGAHVYFLTPQAAQAAQIARERYRTPGYGR